MLLFILKFAYGKICFFWYAGLLICTSAYIICQMTIIVPIWIRIVSSLFKILGFPLCRDFYWCFIQSFFIIHNWIELRFLWTCYLQNISTIGWGGSLWPLCFHEAPYCNGSSMSLLWYNTLWTIPDPRGLFWFYFYFLCYN